MADPNQIPRERDPATVTRAEDTPRGNSRALLWLLLLVVLAILVWYWASQRTVEPAPAIPATDVVAPVDEAVDADNRAADRTTRPGRESRPSDDASDSATPTIIAATPKAGQNPAPTYPASALRVGEGGTVVLRVDVGVDGNPGNIEFVRRSSSRDLDRAARDAVQQWQFNPAMKNGQAMASTIEVPVEFSPDR